MSPQTNYLHNETNVICFIMQVIVLFSYDAPWRLYDIKQKATYWCLSMRR